MEILLKYFSDFTEQQLGQLRSLEGLYKEWNEKINVISKKDVGGLYEKHVLHSLSIAAAFEFSDGAEIIDLGTGGGFPGIPLAIYFPNLRFHLVDSIGKKLKVVEAIASAIGLKNISTQHIRAEDIKNRRFDFVVSRAVAPLKDLWKWSKPLLRSNSSQLPPEPPAAAEGQAQSAFPTQDSLYRYHRGRQARIPNPALICLKGGDLDAEIRESRTKPRIIEIARIFPEVYFKEKFLLYLPKYIRTSP